MGLGLGLALGVGVGLARGDNLDSEVGHASYLLLTTYYLLPTTYYLDSEVGHASYPLDDVTELLVLGCGPSALEGDLPH